MTQKTLLLNTMIGLVSTAAALAAENDWAEGTAAGDDGATRDYYNRAALLPWKVPMGDWRDANDIVQGNTPYATARVEDNDTVRFVQWDVTDLVDQWLRGKHQNQGFFLRTIGWGGKIVFSSRENGDAQRRPSLVLTGAHSSRPVLPQADTYLETSTYRSQGRAETLKVSGAPNHILLRFDLTTARELGRLESAVLRLYTTKQYGDAVIGVFRCGQGCDPAPSKPVLGIASRYPGDRGIDRDPNVVFATDFESDKWAEEWTRAGEMEVIDTVSEDARRRFEPLQGKALRVKMARGANGALNTLFKFQKETGREPEEIYFRYYLRLGSDWNQTLQGGKMPGVSGTYGVAGWGGRKVDGADGWSARGAFFRTIPEKNPLGGLHPIGAYCYHADMKGWYGDSWVWALGYRGFLENNRWYSIEQHLKLNTPRRNDGVLRAWVDGRLAFEKADIRFRDVDRLKIEQVWMNVYHGGKMPSPHDQHLFIDNVVIAKKYIGPMRQ